jgi:hypothetical protein
MPHELHYQRRGSRDRPAQRIVAAILPHRFATTAVLLAFLYVATYAALRVSRVLVHQWYFRWDEDANPGFLMRGAQVEEHNIGRGSFFDGRGNPTNDSLSRTARAVFFPLVWAECWYWRHAED